MKLKILLFTLLIFVVSCGDKAEVQKYKAMQIVSSQMISQCDVVINDQKVKYDSLNQIGSDFINHRISTMDVEGVHRAIINTIDVQSSMKKLRLELESVDLYSSILEKANTRFGYLLKGKSKATRLASKLLYDTNREIEDITGGLTTKAYIYKYLPIKYK
jgi:hypothetical protein